MAYDSFFFGYWDKAECETDLDDCECFACLRVKKGAVEFGRKARENTIATFGQTKYGRPSKRIIKPIKSELSPQKITDENYFFMTGTMPNFKHIHTDKCAEKCVERCKNCDCKK